MWCLICLMSKDRFWKHIWSQVFSDFQSSPLESHFSPLFVFTQPIGTIISTVQQLCSILTRTIGMWQSEGPVQHLLCSHLLFFVRLLYGEFPVILPSSSCRAEIHSWDHISAYRFLLLFSKQDMSVLDDKIQSLRLLSSYLFADGCMVAWSWCLVSPTAILLCLRELTLPRRLQMMFIYLWHAIYWSDQLYKCARFVGFLWLVHGSACVTCYNIQMYYLKLMCVFVYHCAVCHFLWWD